MHVPWEGITALGLYIIGTTGAFIWWAATITEKVNSLLSMVERVTAANYAKKEDIDKDLGRVQKDVDEAHRRIDKMQLNHSN